MINSRKGRFLALLIILGGGISFSLSLCYWSFRHERSKIEDIFNEAAAYRFDIIKDSLKESITSLESFGDFYAASKEVSRDEFNTFSKGIILRYPYIFEFRQLKRVPLGQRQEFEAATHTQIKEVDKDGRFILALNRPEYFPIYYESIAEPRRINRDSVLGLDAASFPERLQEMQTARDTAKITTTGLTKHYGEGDVKNVMRIFLPIYRNGLPYDNLSQRRENLEGFVVELIQFDELITGRLENIPPAGVDIAFYEANAEKKEPFYFYPARTRSQLIEFSQLKNTSGISWSKSLKMADQEWLLVCTPSPDFLNSHWIILPWIVLFISLSLTLLLTFYLRAVIGRQKQIEAIVKQRTEELRAAEGKYRILYESSREAIMMLEPPDWNFIGGNPATLALFGAKDEAEFKAVSPYKLSPEYQPDGQLSVNKARAMIDQAMADGYNFFDWVHKKFDGTEFYASVLLTRIKLSDKVLLQATVRDVTDYKKAEEALRASKEFNERILNTIPFPMDIVDEKGNILYISEKFKSVIGAKWADSKCWELYRDDKTQCLDCPLRTGVKIGETATLETQGVLGGRILLITHTGIIFQDKRAVLELFYDITDYRKIEASVRKLSLAVEQSPTMVVVTDNEGNIEYVNRKFITLTGYTFEEVKGKNPRILKSGEQSSEFYQELWGTIKSGKEWRGQFHNKKKDGSLYWEGALIAPLRDAEGKITNFVAIKEDITELKKTEDELKQAKENLEIRAHDLAKANEELKKLDQLKSDFVSVVSHELRTPLSIMKESISQVYEGMHGDVTDKQKHFLTMSISGINRITRIVEGLLDISRIESGKYHLNKEAVDVVKLAESVAVTFAASLQKKGLELKEEFAPGKHEVLADRDKLMQVFINLIGNAIKFTEHGHIEIRIKEKIVQVECGVADTGIGISAENLPKLFSKFEQFNKDISLNSGGIGLGLNICKGIIELHGGKIWAESRVSQGTRIIFSLPKISAA